MAQPTEHSGKECSLSNDAIPVCPCGAVESLIYPQGVSPAATLLDRSVMRVPNPVSYNSPFLTKSPAQSWFHPETTPDRTPEMASKRPKGLGYQGRKLRDSVVAEFELDSEPDKLRILFDACKLADAVDQLEKGMAGEPLSAVPAS